MALDDVVDPDEEVGRQVIQPDVVASKPQKFTAPAKEPSLIKFINTNPFHDKNDKTHLIHRPIDICTTSPTPDKGTLSFLSLGVQRSLETAVPIRKASLNDDSISNIDAQRKSPSNFIRLFASC